MDVFDFFLNFFRVLNSGSNELWHLEQALEWDHEKKFVGRFFVSYACFFFD